MTNRLRIGHCSDIHLDADGRGDPNSPSNMALRAGFATVLAEIRAQAPNLLLLPGDLFDSNRAAPDTITWAMEILAELPFPIIMIPGNHDCMEDGAIFHRYDFNTLPNVINLTAADGEIGRIPELGVAAWGKGMIEHSRAYSPLGGCPERPADCAWFLGLGHGLFVPHGGDTDRSSPIHMAEIEASHCDYLALGHHHAAMELVTDKATAAYSGSPTDTVGRGRTYIIADLAKDAPPAVVVHTLRGM